MSEPIILSDKEIEQLTGYKLPSKQCKALENAGVRFIKRPDGRLSATREWLLNQTAKPANDDSGFNLEALN